MAIPFVRLLRESVMCDPEACTEVKAKVLRDLSIKGEGWIGDARGRGKEGED